MASNRDILRMHEQTLHERVYSSASHTTLCSAIIVIVNSSVSVLDAAANQRTALAQAAQEMHSTAPRLSQAQRPRPDEARMLRDMFAAVFPDLGAARNAVKVCGGAPANTASVLCVRAVVWPWIQRGASCSPLCDCRVRYDSCRLPACLPA